MRRKTPCPPSSFEDHVVIKDEGGKVAVEEEAGIAVCVWFKDVKAAIHENHGLLTASRHSIEAAAFGSSPWSAAAASN